MSTRLSLLVPVLLLMLLPACTAERIDPIVRLGPGEYHRALVAAREVLRDHRWVIERVDEHAGVVLTADAPSAGLQVPGPRSPLSALGEPADLLNRQDRQVRVTFVPQGEDATPGSVDLSTHEGAVLMQVRATVYRTHIPGYRPQSSSVSYSSYSIDPALEKRGRTGDNTSAIDSDDDLAGRLAGLIVERLRATTPTDLSTGSSSSRPRAASRDDAQSPAR